MVIRSITALQPFGRYIFILGINPKDEVRTKPVEASTRIDLIFASREKKMVCRKRVLSMHKYFS